MKKYINIFSALAVAVICTIMMGAITIEEGGPALGAIAVFSKVCEKNVGGNSAVYLAEAPNLGTITITSGEISAVAMASGKTFHQAEHDLDGAKHTQEGAGTPNNISYTHKVEMFFAKPSTLLNTFRDSLAAASPCGIVAIVRDGNGKCWMVGYNATDGTNRALRLVTDSMDSGNTPTDEAGQRVTITLQAISGYLSLPLDATLQAAVIAGTATFITFA